MQQDSSEEVPIRLEITDVLDLHTFAPRDIPAVVETYLGEARAKGFASVRLIHGKGTGVQRARVRSVLNRTPFVSQFEDAPMEAGSWGATVVWFTKQ
jgi:dsDNA-specific endonuclease/ATPase MutS2